MAEIPVRNALGRPTFKMTPEIWVYSADFAPKNNQAKADGCTELVVVFVDGRVSNIYFANEKARKVLQARIEKVRPETMPFSPRSPCRRKVTSLRNERCLEIKAMPHSPTRAGRFEDLPALAGAI